MEFSLPHPSSAEIKFEIGELGEQLVAQWLQTQGWVILHRRWHCPWGELDLIAQQGSAELAFVEVKTRSRGNWDADGLLAITPNKQAKLWQTAELFLAEHPALSHLPCRFDVALVSCKRISPHSHKKNAPLDSSPTGSKALAQSLAVAGYQLSLQNYIQAAFELNS